MSFWFKLLFIALLVAQAIMFLLLPRPSRAVDMDRFEASMGSVDLH